MPKIPPFHVIFVAKLLKFGPDDVLLLGPTQILAEWASTKRIRVYRRVIPLVHVRDNKIKNLLTVGDVMDQLAKLGRKVEQDISFIARKANLASGYFILSK